VFKRDRAIIIFNIVEDKVITTAVLSSQPALNKQYTDEIKSQQVTEYQDKPLDDVIEKNVNCYLFLIVHN
jgi:hypothetical protein